MKSDLSMMNNSNNNKWNSNHKVQNVVVGTIWMTILIRVLKIWISLIVSVTVAAINIRLPGLDPSDLQTRFPQILENRFPVCSAGNKSHPLLCIDGVSCSYTNSITINSPLKCDISEFRIQIRAFVKWKKKWEQRHTFDCLENFG